VAGGGGGFGGGASCAGEEGNDTGNRGGCQFPFRKPEHTPAGQGRLEVFLDVAQEPHGAVVAALDENAALDFDERAGREVGEVGSPAAWRVEAEFLFEVRATRSFPEVQEAGFETRRRFRVAVAEAGAQAGHAALGAESTVRVASVGGGGDGRRWRSNGSRRL